MQGRTEPGDLGNLPTPVSKMLRLNIKKKKCNKRAEECLRRLGGKKGSAVLFCFSVPGTQLLRSPCALGGVAEAWLDGLSPTRSPLAAQRGLAGLLGGAGMLRSDRAPMGRDHTTVAVCSGLHLPAGLSRGACSSGSASSSGLRELAAHPPDAHSACENA